MCGSVNERFSLGVLEASCGGSGETVCCERVPNEGVKGFIGGPLVIDVFVAANSGTRLLSSSPIKAPNWSTEGQNSSSKFKSSPCQGSGRSGNCGRNWRNSARC
jgi:hypothetical protein